MREDGVLESLSTERKCIINLIYSVYFEKHAQKGVIKCLLKRHSLEGGC